MVGRAMLTAVAFPLQITMSGPRAGDRPPQTRGACCGTVGDAGTEVGDRLQSQTFGMPRAKARPEARLRRSPKTPAACSSRIPNSHISDLRHLCRRRNDRARLIGSSVPSLGTASVGARPFARPRYRALAAQVQPVRPCLARQAFHSSVIRIVPGRWRRCPRAIDHALPVRAGGPLRGRRAG